VFSVRGPCREVIGEYENGRENIGGLNLAVVKFTTVHMTKLPL
jgi:hypothetical protein